MCIGDSIRFESKWKIVNYKQPSFLISKVIRYVTFVEFMWKLCKLKHNDMQKSWNGIKKYQINFSHNNVFQHDLQFIVTIVTT